jgi:hypothetical protein
MKKLLSLLALLASAAHAATLTPIQLISPAGSTSGQVITSTGTATAPTWGNVSASALAAQAANTVLANITASSASPTAVVMPTCNTSTSALQYTPVTGWICYASSATTAGTLAQFAATTSAQLAGVLSDETGSGAAVFGTSPTINTPIISGGTINNATVGITTPLAGKFTTLQATSSITPAYPAGIVGNVTGSAVTAGGVGEPLTATGSAVAATSATLGNVTSLSLTAGDWDVGCTLQTNPAGTTTTQGLNFGLTTTSGAQAVFPNVILQPVSFPAGAGYDGVCPIRMINVSTTTTVYLTAATTFSVSTLTHSGFIWARRR